MGAERPLTTGEQDALRAQGLRPRTFWLPDLDDPAFRLEIAQACREVNRLMAESDDMAFIQAIQYWPPDD